MHFVLAENGIYVDTNNKNHPMQFICNNHFKELLPEYLYYDPNDPTGHTYLESSKHDFVLIPCILLPKLVPTEHNKDNFNFVFKEQIYSDTYQYVMHTCTLKKDGNQWIANLNGRIYKNESIINLIEELVNAMTN